MSQCVLEALNNFDASCNFEQYNMFNCNEVGELTATETDLANSLTATEFTDHETTTIRERVNSDLGAKLIAFSLRMASAALQSQATELISAGAIALTLDSDILDDRDIYVALAVLYDAGTRLSLSMDDLVRQATSSATTRRRKVIEKGFIGGPKYMKSLSSMGVQLQDGNTYSVNMF